ncbi:MAG: DUF5132 domain-containing protein [Pseudomonadota bacterium]|uniref:DUF5132 domain-containing protein n=1 Tax=Thermithiobacillus tepidarius TaxID=929 RepID=UPI000413EABE|nr:DUF5132 domain-containing protein [Thermithiobacillus tepidarius]
MAIIEDMFKGGNIVTGLAIGIGAAVIGPMLMPVVRNVARPVAKAAIKGGIAVYDRGREMAAEVTEMAQDLVAETKAEMAFSGEEAGEQGTEAKSAGRGTHAQKGGTEAKPSPSA